MPTELLVDLVRAILGPFGGIVALVSVGWALLKGHVRFKREVIELERERNVALERADRWEKLSVRFMESNVRAVSIAHTLSNQAPTQDTPSEEK